MRIARITTGLLALLPLATLSAQVNDGPADGASAGASVYQILAGGGLLEDYLPEATVDIVGTLVEAAGTWDGFGINTPYRLGALNIYLVDARKLPEANILDDLGIPLARYSLSGNAMADEATGILFVDTGLLKSLVTAAIIFTETDLDTIAAVGAIRARGIDSFRQVWDPALNPALLTAGYADRWVMLASGAAAFALAHEMGHLVLGADDANQRREPMRFRDKADRDLHWACPDLIQQRYRRQQQIEQAADEYAVDILSRILFPEGVLTEPKLRYELGARWYIVYGMAEQLVQVLYATESENIRRMLRIQFGAEVFDELDARKTAPGTGSIQVWFPESHPANIRRAFVSLGRLAQSPFSVYGGSEPSTDASIAMFDLLLASECANLRARQGD